MPLVPGHSWGSIAPGNDVYQDWRAVGGLEEIRTRDLNRCSRQRIELMVITQCGSELRAAKMSIVAEIQATSPDSHGTGHMFLRI